MTATGWRDWTDPGGSSGTRGGDPSELSLAGLGTAAAAALRRYAAGAASEPESLNAIARVARAARRAGVEPERLVAAVKAAWFALPDVQTRLALADTRIRLQRIVTACADEYFGDG